MSENRENQCRRNDEQRQSDEKLVITSDGQNHKVEASGDVAKGLAAAGAALAGFALGLFLSRR